MNIKKIYCNSCKSETNHDVKDDRLKAMCQLCHLRYDSEEKKRRRNLTQTTS